MRPFELAEPRTVEEAVKLLDSSDPTIRPISGGTALVLMMKQRFFQPTRLVSLRRLKAALGGISADGEGGLRIGALASLRELERSVLVAKVAPVVTRALHTLSNVRVRNVATVGGHLAHGDPHMDLPPVLMGLDATVLAHGPRGSREIKLEELIQGYYQTALAPNEIITELRIPAPDPDLRGSYLKFCSRSADDWTTLGVTVFLRLQNGRLADVKVIVSAATDRPLRLKTVEELLEGERPADTLFAAAGDEAARQVNPLADLHGSAAYKRELVRVQVRRALADATKIAVGGGALA